MKASSWKRWLGLGVALAGFLAAIALLAYQPGSSSATAAPAAPTPAVAELGRALFVAKGCVSCHIRAGVTSDFSTGMGPNLTGLKADPDYLRRWLADPKAVKPNTQMPTLGLSSAEIDALIAFLLSR